jgi:hypothetical protein
MGSPILILMWLALICYAAAFFIAFWRRDPAPWPASIGLIAAGLFLQTLFGLVKGG